MQKYRKAFLILMFTTLSVAGFSQANDSLEVRKFYEQNLIRWEGGSRYFKNNVALPVRKLELEYLYSKDAMKEFGKYKTEKTIGITGFVLTAALLTTSIVTTNTRNRRINYNTGYLIASAVTLSASITITIKSKRHLGRSVWLYNRDTLLR